MGGEAGPAGATHGGPRQRNRRDAGKEIRRLRGADVYIQYVQRGGLRWPWRFVDKRDYFSRQNPKNLCYETPELQSSLGFSLFPSCAPTSQSRHFHQTMFSCTQTL